MPSKYTPPRGRIVLSAHGTDERLRFEIRNYGAETPAADLPKIFDKFYRGVDGDRWKQGGMGLGLALVKQLVDYLGGAIEVVSSGQTAFTVHLPVRPDRA